MLTVKEIENAKQGRHADGNGLYLQVTATGSKSWLYWFTLNGKRRQMGLGSLRDVGPKEARIKLAELRVMVHAGIDPIAANKAPTAVTFKELAIEHIEHKSQGFRNKKHVQQWHNTLRDYAYPIIGHLHPKDITTEHVLSILKPIWYTKTETASRVRGRIEKVMDSARAKGHWSGLNPALWGGHLKLILPEPKQVTPIKHYSALDYRELPAFINQLRDEGGIVALCLEWTILSGGRDGNTLAARWDQLDLDQRMWTIPNDLMKARREHSAPITERMMEILHEAAALRRNDYVFPSPITTVDHLSEGSLRKLIQKLHPGITPHGFRSTFTTWCAETQDVNNDLAELQLAHVVDSKTEQSYRRTTMLEKRRSLMQTYEEYAYSVAKKKHIK